MPYSHLWLGLLGLLVAVNCAHGLVMGIDLGSQWYKMAMVRPGRPIDIVLNEQSSRKTHTMVGWNKEERAFGSDALNLQSRYPANAYAYLTPLLGKSHNHPFFKEVADWITFNIVDDPERGSFLIKHDANTTFKPEELVGMILRHAKELASASFGAPIKDCVIAIPPFLTQHERQAVMDAAAVAGLNVLSLINDVTAFAMIYARDRFDNETQNVIFYDVGATSAKALLATFQSIPDIKSTKNKTIVQVLVRSVAWDRTLGGRFIDRNIANHFKSIIKKKYPDFNVNDVKLTLRLLREAQKLKEVLSANQLAQVSLVGLGDHDDIIVSMTRKELEDLNKDVAERALVPIQSILEEANMTKEDITYVEVVGGTTRVPMIQNALKTFLGREELDRHVNGDEGAALGAAFFAAGMSSTFKSSKEIRLRDITPYPVNVKINLDQASEGGDDIIIEEGEAGDDKSHAALLTRGNKLNTRRALTFFSYSNFSLNLSYAQADVLPAGSKHEIQHISVAGMPLSTKYNITGKPKVHASFKLSSNGTVTLDHADVEITVLEPPKPKVKKPVTKEASTNKTEDEIKLEGSNTGEPKSEEAKPEEKTEEESKTSEQGEVKEEAKGEEEAEKEAQSKEEQAEQNKEEDETEEPVVSESGEPVLVPRTFKLPLKIISVENLGVKSFDRDSRLKSEMRLSHYDWLDTQRKELQREKNGLESFIYEMRDKLDTDEIIEASTETERDELRTALASANEWLDENSETATTAEYRTQSKTLKDKAEKIYFRIREQRAFPKAAAELRKAMESNRDILQTIMELRNVTEEERDEALKQIDGAVGWYEAKTTEQFAVAKNVDPVVTSEELKRKQSDIEFIVKMLLRKPKKKIEIPKIVLPEDEDAENKEGQEDGAEKEPKEAQEGAGETPKDTPKEEEGTKDEEEKEKERAKEEEEERPKGKEKAKEKQKPKEKPKDKTKAKPEKPKEKSKEKKDSKDGAKKDTKKTEKKAKDKKTAKDEL